MRRFAYLGNVHDGGAHASVHNAYSRHHYAPDGVSLARYDEDEDEMGDLDDEDDDEDLDDLDDLDPDDDDDDDDDEGDDDLDDDFGDDFPDGDLNAADGVGWVTLRRGPYSPPMLNTSVRRRAPHIGMGSGLATIRARLRGDPGGFVSSAPGAGALLIDTDGERVQDGDDF